MHLKPIRITFVLALPLLAAAAPSQAGSERFQILATQTPEPPAALKAVLRGVLKDLDGRPLDGVELSLFRRGLRSSDRGSSLFLDSCARVRQAAPVRTDGEGEFALEYTIDPERDYFFRWSGDGVETGSSGWLTPTDLHFELDLVAVARRPFFGRLLDQDQQPIAEAEVRTRREGDIAVKTDAQGAFRLAFVSERSEPLVVRLADGRFAWFLVSAEGSGKDVIIGQDASTATPRPPLPSAAVLKGLESDLRKQALEVAIRHRHYIEFRWRLIDLAKVDLAGALRRLESEDLDGWFESVKPAHFHNHSTCGADHVSYDSVVREGVDLREYIGVQLRLAADNSDKQARSDLEALTTGDPSDWFFRARMGFELPKFSTGQEPPANDEGLVEQALSDVAEASSESRYQQVQIYVRTSLKLLNAGHEEEATTVMSKATAIVAPGKTPSYLSNQYIHALCRFDLDAGLELIRAKAKDRYKGLMTEAVRLAPESPGAAIKILHEAEALPVPRYHSFRSRTWVQRVVYGLSEKDPAVAEELARRYDPTGYSLGLVALSLSRHADSADSTGADERLERVRRLLDAAYKSARTIHSPTKRSRAVASLLRVARDADALGLQTWLAQTLWASTPAGDAGAGDSNIAWTVRAEAPLLASSMAFAALSQSVDDLPFLTSTWSIAAWFDPVRAAGAAAQEGGEGLGQTADALREQPVGPAVRLQTSLGDWWPRE